MKRGRWKILYDGHCHICLRTMETFRRLDFFHSLDYVDFRKTPTDGLPVKALEAEMHVIGPGGVVKGYDAYRSLALALPLAWPLVPFLWLPGVSTIGRLVYARVAAGRFSGSPCSGTHCQIPAHRHETAPTSLKDP